MYDMFIPNRQQVEIAEIIRDLLRAQKGNYI